MFFVERSGSDYKVPGFGLWDPCEGRIMFKEYVLCISCVVRSTRTPVGSAVSHLIPVAPLPTERPVVLGIRSGWWGGKAEDWFLNCKGYVAFLLFPGHKVLCAMLTRESLHQYYSSFCLFTVSLCAGVVAPEPWAASEWGSSTSLPMGENPDLSCLSRWAYAAHRHYPVCGGGVHAPAVVILAPCYSRSSWGELGIHEL